MNKLPEVFKSLPAPDDPSLRETFRQRFVKFLKKGDRERVARFRNVGTLRISGPINAQKQ